MDEHLFICSFWAIVTFCTIAFHYYVHLLICFSLVQLYTSVHYVGSCLFFLVVLLYDPHFQRHNQNIIIEKAWASDFMCVSGWSRSSGGYANSPLVLLLLDTPAAALLGGRRRPREALSPFCQSKGIQCIIYVTPGGPLDAAETEQHWGNFEARGQFRNRGRGNQSGPRGNERREIKRQKGGLGECRAHQNTDLCVCS